MAQVHSTTSEHVKGKHLSRDDRHLLQIRLKDKRPITEIAAELNCSRTTIYNEISRGSVRLYAGNVVRYKCDVGQAAYEESHQNSVKRYDYLEKQRFIEYVEKHFFEDGWSLDVCYGRALKSGEFDRSEMVSVKTLYSYVELGLIRIKNHHLPEKLKQKPHKSHSNENKKVLGRSIDERDSEIELRTEFGHWECDLVLGKKSGDHVILTMLERMSRMFLMIEVKDKTSESVLTAFKDLFNEYSEHAGEVFKTITSDNGSEFAKLSELETLAETLVYFAHPYTACERGSNERHNGLIRRFIPKGKRIDSYPPEYIGRIELWVNSLPRKILDYETPEEVFDRELDAIYAIGDVA